jgi:hypothetical protein
MSQDLTLPNAADFCPDVESLAPGSSELGGSDMIPTDIKQGVDLIVGRQKALRLAGRFELLHLPLSSACRLVWIFGSVVQSLVPAMLSAGDGLAFGCAIAGQLVGDHDAGRPHLLLAPRGGTATIGGIMNFVNNIMGVVAPITTGYIVGPTHSFTGAFLTAGIVLVVGIVAYVFILGRLEPIADPPTAWSVDA